MIGPKQLSAIREELRQALAATGDDPIRWLEERMAAPEHLGTAPACDNEILDSLHRLLEASDTATRSRQHVRKKS